MFESGRVSIDDCLVCRLITKATRELITRVRKNIRMRLLLREEILPKYEP